MSDHACEVLVVGAGPAGSAMATVLARSGHDVLLVDRSRFPRPKPCGEFVNPGAVAAMTRLGLLGAIEGLSPARIGGWTIQAERTRVARGQFGAGVFGLGIPRTEFDHAMLRFARLAGTQVHERVNVLAADRSAGGGWEVRVRAAATGTGTIRCRFLVAADGLRSRLARQLGAVRRGRTPAKVSLTCHLAGRGPHPGTGRLYTDDRLTIGLAPTHASGERWNVTVVVDPDQWSDALSTDAAGIVRDLLTRLPVAWSSEPSIVAGPWASGPFDWPSRRFAGPDHVLVGDAAGYYDPLTGQGICRALRTVELAAPLVSRVLRDPTQGPAAARAYARRVLRDRRSGRRVQHLIDATLSRSWSRNSALSLLARGHSRLTPLLRVTGDISKPVTLLRPSTWLPTFGRERRHAYG